MLFFRPTVKVLSEINWCVQRLQTLFYDKNWLINQLLTHFLSCVSILGGRQNWCAVTNSVCVASGHRNTSYDIWKISGNDDQWRTSHLCWCECNVYVYMYNSIEAGLGLWDERFNFTDRQPCVLSPVIRCWWRSNGAIIPRVMFEHSLSVRSRCLPSLTACLSICIYLPCTHDWTREIFFTLLPLGTCPQVVCHSL